MQLWLRYGENDNHIRCLHFNMHGLHEHNRRLPALCKQEYLPQVQPNASKSHPERPRSKILRPLHIQLVLRMRCVHSPELRIMRLANTNGLQAVLAQILPRRYRHELLGETESTRAESFRALVLSSLNEQHRPVKGVVCQWQLNEQCFLFHLVGALRGILEAASGEVSKRKGKHLAGTWRPLLHPVS